MIINGHHLFLQDQKIVQRFTYKIDGNCAAGKINVGDHAVSAPSSSRILECSRLAIKECYFVW